jgi:hypothetical protein
MWFWTLFACTQPSPLGGRADEPGIAPSTSSSDVVTSVAQPPAIDVSDALASYTWPTATNPGPELHVERTGDVDADGVADAALTPVETEGWAVVSGAARGAFILPQAGAVARVVGWAIGDETHAQHAQFADLDSDGDVDFIGLRRDGVVALDGPLAGTLDVASARLLVAADLSDAARGGGVSGLVVADYSGDGTLEIALLWGAVANGLPVPTAWLMDGPFTSVRSLADATRFSIRAPAIDSLGDVCSDILPEPIGDSNGDSVYEMILAPNCAPAHVLAADAVGSYEIGVGGDGFLDSSEWLNSLQVLGDLDGDGASDLYVKAHPEEEVGLVFGALPADLTSANALVAQARLVVGGSSIVRSLPVGPNVATAPMPNTGIRYSASG